MAPKPEHEGRVWRGRDDRQHILRCQWGGGERAGRRAAEAAQPTRCRRSWAEAEAQAVAGALRLSTDRPKPLDSLVLLARYRSFGARVGRTGTGRERARMPRPFRRGGRAGRSSAPDLPPICPAPPRNPPLRPNRHAPRGSRSSMTTVPEAMSPMPRRSRWRSMRMLRIGAIRTRILNAPRRAA